MEGFNEQVVKRDKTVKSLMIKIIAVVLLFVIPLTFVLLARFFPIIWRWWDFFCLSAVFILCGGCFPSKR